MCMSVTWSWELGGKAERCNNGEMTLRTDADSIILCPIFVVQRFLPHNDRNLPQSDQDQDVPDVLKFLKRFSDLSVVKTIGVGGFGRVELVRLAPGGVEKELDTFLCVLVGLNFLLSH